MPTDDGADEQHTATIGVLRLGPHLLEVPISAMLVLGVSHAAGAESVASGRIMETVVGAIAGVLVNLAFPPPVATRDASRADGGKTRPKIE